MASVRAIAWEDLFSSVASSQAENAAIDWDTYAKAYDYLPMVFQEYRQNLAIVEQRIGPILDQLPQGLLLDVGAGTGNYISHFANRFPDWRYVHLDSNCGMNNVARRKYGGLQLGTVSVVESSAQDVIFAAEQADIVLCVNALYAMAPQSLVLKKLYRWLKPNGVFVCIDFGRKQNPLDWVGSFFAGVISGQIPISTATKALGAFGNVFIQALRGAGGQSSGQYWMHEMPEFKAAIVSAGFQVEDSFTCYREYCDGVIARKTA